MKKIILMLFLSLLSFSGYAQLAEEGFETGWTLSATGTGTTGWFTIQNNLGTNITWVQGPANSTQLPAHTGERAAYLQRQNVSGGLTEDYLVTPVFTVPVNPELHFFSRLTQVEDQGSIYKVFIINLTATPGANINSPASYTELKSWTELEINPVQTDYYEKILLLPEEYMGAQVRIAFMMAGDEYDRWLIDDVKVVKTCVNPTSLKAVNIDLHSAKLQWTNPGNSVVSWDIELIPEDAVPTGEPTHTHTGSTLFHATGLEENTCYKYYIRANCGEGAESEWVGAHNFCTLITGESCQDPIVIAALPYLDTDNTATFGDQYNGVPGLGCGDDFQDYLTGNDVVYRYIADFTGAINIDLIDVGPNSGVFVYNSCNDIGQNCLTGGVGNFDGNDVFLEDFPVTNGEDYYIVISTFIAQTTPYTLIIQAVSCDEPIGLPVENAGTVSAELSWTNPTGASSWQVVVQTAGAGIPPGAGTIVTDNTNYLWSGLIASTAYEYWVRADCSNGTFSAWAGPYHFNTMACEPSGQCALTFTMSANFQTWNGHTMSVKQNGITIASLTGPLAGEETSAIDVLVCDGLPFQLFWNSGPFLNDYSNIKISIASSFGQEIFVKNPGEGAPNTLLYEVVASCNEPYCLPPAGLTATNATQTTVDLGWNGPPAGEWEYIILDALASSPSITDTGTQVATNPAIGAGPLTPATNYKFYARIVCEETGNLSPWSKGLPFSSSICPEADKCDYTFILKSAMEIGWQGAIMTVRQDGTNVAVIGPSFTDGAAQTITIPLCDDVPFEIFWNDGGLIGDLVGLTIINPFDQTLFEFPFNSWNLVTTILYNDLADCQNPACMPPTGLTASNSTMTSIDLAWDGVATGSWEYIIIPTENLPPTDTTPGIATSTNPTIAAPLPEPSTNYKYYVREVCTFGGTIKKSKWTGPYLFHSEACEEAAKCTFYFEMQSQSGIGYGSGNETHTMTVYQEGVPIVILGPGFNSASEDPFSQTVEVKLCTDKEFEIVWNTGGIFGDSDKGLHVYSPYLEDVYIKGFTGGILGEVLYTGIVDCGQPACPKPKNLQILDISTTSVTLDWQETGTATSWEVWVMPYGSPEPTTPSTITNAHPLVWNEGLKPSTAYQFYVKALCGPDSNSTITGPFDFVTAIGNDNCNGAIDVPVNNAAACIESFTGTLTTATSSGIIPSCVGEGVEDVWYKFTAQSSDHILSMRKEINSSFNIAVFKGNDCGELTEIFCGLEFVGKTVISELTIGNTYYIQVYRTPWAIHNPNKPVSFELCVSTLQSISTDNTIPVPEMVQNILLATACADVSNITWSTGTNFSSVNGIAFFEKNTSSFGIEEGIVLVTADAMQTPGPNLTSISYGEEGWPGDDQLSDYLEDLNIYPLLPVTSNATILEFDFIPQANKLKVPFIFASDLYGFSQCLFADTFAFFLTGPDGQTVNIALVPGTETPIAVTKIRNEGYSEFNNPDPTHPNHCPSVNESYFESFYGVMPWGFPTPEPGLDPITAPINFNGNTVKMLAKSDVIPGETYHVKLVIAMNGVVGRLSGSAVFIGKFDMGEPNLGIDLTVADGNALCAGTQYTIESGLDPADYTFIWSKNETVIEGETGPNLVVTSTGDYKVVAEFSTGCISTDSVRIEFYEDINVITEDPVQLTVCDPDGFAIFDLSDNTAVILEGLNPADYTISYHLTEADAQNDENQLPLTGYDNITQFEQIIYVRITNEAGCKGIKSFSLIVQDLTPIFTVNQDFSICEGTSGTITITPTAPANYDPAVATYSWTLNGGPLPDTTSSITAAVAGVYEATVNNTGCTATDSITIAVIPTPVADDPADVTECNTYILLPLSQNNKYFTGPGGTGTPLSAGDAITSSQVIYVFAQNPDNTTCTAENSFMVTIIPVPELSITDKCEGNQYMLNAGGSFNPDSTTYEWTGPNGFTSTAKEFAVPVTGIYNVTVTIDQACTVEAVFEVVNITCLIPRGISPNGDEKNDEFDLSALGVKMLKIFNRYGQEVYSKGNYTKEWHGQGNNGDELPTGTYFYMIERSNGESITGWVYINRQE